MVHPSPGLAVVETLHNVIVFPRSSPPPGELPPYERSPTDPHVFQLPLVDCRHRGGFFIGCCKSEDLRNNHSYWCAALEEPCDRVKCFKCDRRE